MRERVRAAHPVRAGHFDLKHSPGGMMDVEFVVQYLVLLHSGAQGALQDNAGNIALLQRAEAAGLLPQGMGLAAANAYRDFRHLQHRARLDESALALDLATAPPDAAWRADRAAVLALWEHVLAV
jgi:glutamate-ammonia-ligase adenylyltransferase